MNQKLQADRVYGSNFGMSKDHTVFLVKVDLGTYHRAFLMSHQVLRFLLTNLPTLNGVLLGEQPTIPELHSEDWDGARTAMVSGLTVIEAANGMALDLTLVGGRKAAFAFDERNWKHFSDNIWQYQPLLPDAP